LRLPNHFRAIFGEGAFNAAYVPAYARAREQKGEAVAGLFSSRIFTLLIASQVVLLALALPFMPQIVRLLAPGFAEDPAKFELTVTLTRITFPYLLMITLVTQLTGTLNAIDRFAAGAFAPVLLNLSLVAALAIAFLFPTAAHAAAWGVTFAGAAELLLLVVAARRAGAMPGLARPKADPEVKGFFRALGPATIGSAGVQIAMFADTIIASLLPTGAMSSVYYADRLYQLPVGVVGIAAGTVLLPEMSRRIAAGEPEAAITAQNRAMALTCLAAAPFFVGFLIIPELIMSALFARGAFSAASAQASSAVLFAYALGLPAVVLIRSAVASFQARGDTTTPMAIALAAVAANVALKIVLAPALGAPGLAYATSAGAWINLGALYLIAMRRGFAKPDATLARVLASVGLAGAALAGVFLFGQGPAAGLGRGAGSLASEATLLVLGLAGAIAYLAVAFGSLKAFRVPLRRLR
jgi:putative peptidoglycan lipid II flippase